MKTKMMLAAVLLGTAALSANAGVRFGVSFHVPVVVTAPVAPVVVVPTCPAPAVLVERVPNCPGVDYVWAPGCWSWQSVRWVWTPGAWRYHPAHYERPAHFEWNRAHEGYRR